MPFNVNNKLIVFYTITAIKTNNKTKNKACHVSQQIESKNKDERQRENIYVEETISASEVSSEMTELQQL